MNKVEQYRKIRRESIEILSNIEFTSGQIRSFIQRWETNHVKIDEGALQYAMHFLSIENEMSAFDKYCQQFDLNHPDNSMLKQMQERYTSYFMVKEIHDGYITIMDLKTNKLYDIYDISLSINGWINNKIIYSTIIQVDGIAFFAGYEIIITEANLDNYLDLVNRNKKRIRLTTNEELKELLAVSKLSKFEVFYSTV